MFVCFPRVFSHVFYEVVDILKRLNATTRDIPMTAIEAQIPTVSDTSGKRGDLLTKVGWRIPLRCSPPFDRFARLVMEAQLGHIFATHNQILKSQSLRSMGKAKPNQVH
jgi:hypothetical protein